MTTPYPFRPAVKSDWLTQSKTNGEFVETGLRIFESEDLTNSLITIYLSMSANGWDGGLAEHGTIDITNVVEFYRRGIWLPCTTRVAICGQLDIRNDGRVGYAAIPVQMEDGDFAFVTAKQVEKPHIRWGALPGSSEFYSMGAFFKRKNDRRGIRKRLDTNNDIMHFDGWHFSLVGDRLHPMKRAGEWPYGDAAAIVAKYGSAAIQTVADFSNLWIVETKETAVDGLKTPMRLGVNADMVRSLFYARSNPVTETQRKRPILHWVRSHLRRVKSGIDIEIEKHLRGIEEFEMDGFPFRITQPRKNKVLS